ncbi:MAG: alanine racemase [Candidatus Eisenbacteria bacterium]|nr:alanine racemase [Candidatus Eisenbacteria bacterium]MCC7144422.1 alanine racemase [Candidatus Eisenbacteria bacterium]
MDPRAQLLSWIELDVDALKHNLRLFRQRTPERTRLLLVVKANAYGHGLEPVVRATGSEVDAFGVHTIDEAHAVRDAGWSGPLLIMGHVAHARAEEICALAAEPTLFDLATLRRLDALALRRRTTIHCHLKVETGTHRQGADADELAAMLAFFAQSNGVRLKGLSTHFANIEDTTDHGYAKLQLERFRAIATEVEERGFRDVIRHTACTAAALTLPETCYDMVRLGIGAYGIWPSRETLASTRALDCGNDDLRPVLSWRTRITQLKWVPKGAYVGYGLTHRCTHATRLAVLPIGYSDGYPRALSGVAHVLVGGRRAPVLGRICMNITLCDVTDCGELHLEEEVVLLGAQGDETIGAERMAAWGATIPYEILARLAAHTPRLLRENPVPGRDAPLNEMAP